MILTVTEFFNKWNEVFITNGQRLITGEKMNLFLTDLCDSVPSWFSSGGSSLPYFGDLIAVEDLDVDNVVIKKHSLNTYAPVVFVFNNSGIALNGSNFSYKATDADNVEITLEDLPTSGYPYKMLVISVANNITANIDYITLLTETFTNWEGAGWETNPVGWTVRTTDYDMVPTTGEIDETCRIYDDNGAACIVGDDTGTAGYLILESDNYLESGESYTVRFEYTASAGSITFFIDGVEKTLPLLSGVFEETIVASGTTKFRLMLDFYLGYTLTIDNLTVTKL
jgi:hypothetical protein